MTLLNPFCAMQWQYSPENTVLAKRRRAKRAAQAASGDGQKLETPISPNKVTRGRATPIPDRAQGNAQNALSGHARTAGLSIASLGVSEAEGGTTDTSPEENSGVSPARRHEAFSVEPTQLPPQLPAQLPSQLPSQLPAPLPATQATPRQTTPAPPTATPPTPTQAPHLSGDPATSGHLQGVVSKPSPKALPAQTEATRGEPQQSLTDLLTGHSPSAAPETSVLPSTGLTAQMAAANSSPGAKSSAHDAIDRPPLNSAHTPHTQVPPEQACKAASDMHATPSSTAYPRSPIHQARAVPEKSPEPTATAEGPEAVRGPGLVTHAMHQALVQSRSMSQDRQQQPRQLSVPNPFRVSQEKLSLFSAQPPDAAQSSGQNLHLSGPARAGFCSVSPEALHVMELGTAELSTTTMQNDRSASGSKSPEVPLLPAPVPLRDAQPQLTAASSGGLQATVAKWTAALAGLKPKLSVGLLGRSQSIAGQEDVVNGSTAEKCSGSECTSEQKQRSSSPDLAAKIMLTQQKLARKHAEEGDRRTEAQQHPANMPSADGHMHASAVVTHPNITALHSGPYLAAATTDLVQGVADSQQVSW